MPCGCQSMIAHRVRCEGVTPSARQRVERAPAVIAPSIAVIAPTAPETDPDIKCSCCRRDAHVYWKHWCGWLRGLCGKCAPENFKGRKALFLEHLSTCMPEGAPEPKKPHREPQTQQDRIEHLLVALLEKIS